MHATAFVLLIAVFLGAVTGKLSRANLRTYNIDPTYSRWKNNTVPFYIDPYYNATEQGYILSAFKQFQNNMVGCLTFVQVAITDPRFKAHVTPYNESGVLQSFCYSYPGVNNINVNAKATSQVMVITRGYYGCLDGTARSIMKIIAIMVGKRNEHQRGDRDTYLSVNLANVAIANAYRLYNTSEAYWLLFPYDYCSITHNQPTDYAIPGLTVFTPLCTPPIIPKLGQISNTDCQLISMIYQCQPSLCPPLNCYKAQLAASGSGSGTSTTMASTTTTPLCSLQRFCNTAPDESGYLLGPYQLSQTLVLYNGPCVMEYNENFAAGGIAGSLVPSVSPELLTTYLSGTGAGSVTAPTPVNLAYNVIDPTTGLLSYNIDNGAGTTLTCSTNPTFSTVPNAVQCPTAAAGGNAISTTGNSVVSSASSQIFLGTFVLYQYGVISPANTEIGLYSQDFKTLYQATTNFLSGQSQIVKITAIQVIQDETAVNPQRFGVFGVGADGVTPYFGYANANFPINADTSVPLTGFSWTTPPVPLNQAIAGCAAAG